MNKVIYKYGSKASVENIEITPGTLYFLTDTKEIIFDTPDGRRVVMGSDNVIPQSQIEELFK